MTAARRSHISGAAGGGSLSSRWILWSLWWLGLAALIQAGLERYGSGALAASTRWQAVLAVAAFMLGVGGLVLLRAGDRVEAVVDAWRSRLAELGRLRLLGPALVILVAAGYPLAVFGPTGRFLEGLFPRLLLFWATTLLLMGLVRGLRPAASDRQLLLACAIGYGLVLRALAFVPEVSTYPFSLGWSEASRYYYASLFHAKELYGFFVSPSELHPTRYLLQSIPFTIPGLPLWFHRMWQVLLWAVLPALTAGLLIRRLGLTSAWTRWMVGGWIVLYLFQGPVYYHLLVMVVLVLIGVDARRPWRSTLFVLAASAWAGISRVNWYPVPGLLAGALFLLELPGKERVGWKPLAWPILWTALGTAIALGAQAAYIGYTGAGLDRFTSSLSSDLLYYRLLPNPTYAAGILPAIVFASAPLLVALWRARTAWAEGPDRVSRWYLGGALGLLGAGGLVVSLKIGGGSNLHNFDAYLVFLLLAASLLCLRGSSDSAGGFPGRLDYRTALAVVAVPLVFAVSTGSAWTPPDSRAASAALAELREQVETVSARGGRVLFISQRHLLTFGQIQGVPLEPEFETVFLMEMAMSGNRGYLDRFHALLRDHHYALIVVDHLNPSFQGSGHSFGEENDAWVREVALPILCSYRSLVRFEQPPVELLVPGQADAECPD